MKSALMIAVFAGAGLLIAWTLRNRRRFDRDYAFSGTFAGECYECQLGGLDLEQTMLCFAGADREALYLLPYPRPRQWLLGSRRGVLRKSLRIPWQDFECRAGTVPIGRPVIWFRFEERRIYLYVPKEIGETLLREERKTAPG